MYIWTYVYPTWTEVLGLMAPGQWSFAALPRPQSCQSGIIFLMGNVCSETHQIQSIVALAISMIDSPRSSLVTIL